MVSDTHLVYSVYMDGKRDVWQTVKVIEEVLDHTCALTMTPTQTLDAMKAVRRLADRMDAEAAVWTAGPAGPRESWCSQDLRRREECRDTPARLPGDD
ncbi:hypothetical protein AXH35_11905 [Acidipropionibacterium acidipropionici]|uniref:Uncharacterized protein n=2 Tax=Acidipropionibacterium acidipropionici TaxID=1748 RepID=A0AAC8YHB6_9ACTN|nr:hypothetical protein AXH35_11905 [Acidipropionibacterium acidipropionici]AOZ47495.1 hypothetical protein A8L58_13355 [Acidipropionibacterium acidipropionici]